MLMQLYLKRDFDTGACQWVCQYRRPLVAASETISIYVPFFSGGNYVYFCSNYISFNATSHFKTFQISQPLLGITWYVLSTSQIGQLYLGTTQWTQDVVSTSIWHYVTSVILYRRLTDIKRMPCVYWVPGTFLRHLSLVSLI